MLVGYSIQQSVVRKWDAPALGTSASHFRLGASLARLLDRLNLGEYTPFATGVIA